MSLPRPVPSALIVALVLGIPSASHAQSGQSFSTLAQSAAAAREAGHMEDAVRDYTAGLALKPDWAEGWFYLGVIDYEQNQYPEAVAALAKVVQLSPGPGPAWSFLGLAQFETGDYDAARASLQKARAGPQADPELAHVSAYHLALLMIRISDFGRAAALLRSTFGGQMPAQAKAALGMTLLRIPLLPDAVDPSKDALIQAAGAVAAAAPDAESTSPEASDLSSYIAALRALIAEHPQTPYLRYALGLALAESGQNETALSEQRQEAQISPASPLPLIALSAVEGRLHHPSEAIATARRAVALAPEDAAARAALSAALSLAGRAAESVEQNAAAGALTGETPPDPRMTAMYALHAAAAAANTDAPAWAAAMQAYSAGEYRQAVAALKTWLEARPQDGTAWAVMGLSEFALKDYANALIHLERGRDLGLGGSSESVEMADYTLSLLLIRDSQFNRASAILAGFSGKPPLAQQVQFALGLALLRAPTLPDDVPGAAHGLYEAAGQIAGLLLVSEYDKAFPKFDALLRQYPGTPFLHYAYATALDALSQYDEADSQLQSEIRMSPASSLPWELLASIALRRHAPQDALTAAGNAVRIAPASADARYVLGRAYSELNQPQKAVSELEQARNLAPGSPEIHFALAAAYAKAGMPQQAAAERAAFLQLDRQQPSRSPVPAAEQP
jgi:tetratricopeptide (TPR) repeat protein